MIKSNIFSTLTFNRHLIAVVFGVSIFRMPHDDISSISRCARWCNPNDIQGLEGSRFPMASMGSSVLLFGLRLPFY